ncbi:MAG: DUF2493 domain-containing protein [candidate division Zixibacteria bacterium]|jgi:hypothetical protein|nr:DUF2493 domain-containing protein [candidate division Zixibacteria bacterium]
MRLIIAGSRDCTDYQTISTEVDQIMDEYPITEIVSGGARGVDALGERYAREHGLPCTRFPADWSRYGRSAGPRRNREMAAYGDFLIAFTSGGPGTTNMIREMRQVGKPVVVVDL